MWRNVCSPLFISVDVTGLSQCQCVYVSGGYTVLEDMSDVQDDMTDVFRTTKIKINGGFLFFLNGAYNVRRNIECNEDLKVL